MSEDRSDADQPGAEPPATPDAAPSRRRLLMLGAASASMVVTIRPALASTAGSVLNCEIPIPDRKRAGAWIDADGGMVPPRTPGAFRPPSRAIKGEEARKVLASNGTYRGASYEESQAYSKYIRRLQGGMSGFTCYASLQMPRR